MKNFDEYLFLLNFLSRRSKVIRKTKFHEFLKKGQKLELHLVHFLFREQK